MGTNNSKTKHVINIKMIYIVLPRLLCRCHTPSRCTKTPFFNWLQTSVRLCALGLEYIGKIGLILKVRNVTICSSFFRKLLEEIYLENSIFKNS